MKRTRIIGLCLMAVCAMFALTATVASAENLPHLGFCKAQAGGKYKSSGCTKLAKEAAEEKFEWTPMGASLVKFTSAKEKETGPAVLEAASGTEISCTGQGEKEGEYGPGDQDKNVIGEFSGCKALGGSCNSPGKEAEKIDTLKLHGEPGVVTYNAKTEKNIAGFDLKGQTSEFLAEFSCSGAPVKVRGGIVVKLQNFGSSGFAGLQTNKMVNKAKVAFISEKVAKQVPSKWNPNGGGITHSAGEHTPAAKKETNTEEHLEASLAGGAYENSGQFLRTLQKSVGAVKLEVRMCEEVGKNAITC
jgi:hypothetical protein